ncbi:MAG: hypothetical protein ABIL58_29110 [Pseudomonadota bacterium]
MTRPIRPVDLDGISTYALADRDSKVARGDFARHWTAGGRFTDFIDTLPKILAGSQLRAVIDAVATAAQADRTVMVGMGAHVIKVGLNPILTDLMHRGVISCLAMNGAGIIHDVELAMTGRTSEDVAAALGDGAFGMARETGEFLAAAIQRAKTDALGLGRAVGAAINANGLPFAGESLLAAGAALDIPVTVHVAMGTDIIHMHPQFDPAAAGAASHLDFRMFAGAVATLENGVYLNVGSAVILPEVFLKALTLVRNLGHTVNRFTTVNLDFIQHYRPATNVVHRPTLSGGRGFSLTGHHEIMLPLIAAGVIEALGTAR